jgi:hypothetical protein
MFKVGMSFNGKRITSSAQMKREIERATRQALDTQVRRSAGPGVQVTKTQEGYKLAGSEAGVKRALKKLGHI